MTLASFTKVQTATHDADSPSSGHLTIRKAELSDVRVLADIHASLFDPGWSEHAFRQMIGNPRTISLVSEAGKPSGFIVASNAGPEAELLTFGVATRHQRTGAGRDLMAALLKQLKHEGCQALYLEVAVDNAAAMSLYLTTGFEVVGERPGYYARQGRPPVDAHIMSVTLAG
ncbi:MAG: GNAT family N-acetyltransferase [Pseudomonadota bacterium]